MAEIFHNEKNLNRRGFLSCIGAAALSVGFTKGLLNTTSAWSDTKGLKNPPLLINSDKIASRINETKLQSVIDFLGKEHQAGSFPGAAVVGSCGDKIFIEHYIGTYYTMLGDEAKYHPGVISLFSSFSKGISATIVMMAHQDGLIDIDAPVARYIPEFAAHNKEKVTLRHILTHSAGIPNAPKPFKPMRNEEEWNSAIDAICQAEPEWAAGSQTAYHGSAMMIPAEIVRRVSDYKTWDAICRERIFEPVKAASLTFNMPENESLVSLGPKDSDRLDGSQQYFPGHPGAGCFGALQDGLRILQLHLNKGTWEGRSLLNSDTFQEMHRVQYETQITEALARGERPKHDFWGLGWLLRGNGPIHDSGPWFGLRDQKNPHIFGHAGIDTIIGIADPEHDVAFIFNTTRSPKTKEEAVRLRNEVSNRVMAAVNDI